MKGIVPVSKSKNVCKFIYKQGVPLIKVYNCALLFAYQCVFCFFIHAMNIKRFRGKPEMLNLFPSGNIYDFYLDSLL